MAQWMSLHWNNSFVNRMLLPLLCETSGAILLVLVCLTAGKQVDEILVDEILVDLEFLNSLLIASLGFSRCLTKGKVYCETCYGGA